MRTLEIDKMATPYQCDGLSSNQSAGLVIVLSQPLQPRKQGYRWLLLDPLIISYMAPGTGPLWNERDFSRTIK